GPGMIGRCESSGLVCLEDADCDEEAEERCRHFFCANDPGRACHDPAITTSDRPSDAECAPSFCGSGNPTTCSTDPRVPADFRGLGCKDDVDCVPAGICRPLL